MNQEWFANMLSDTRKAHKQVEVLVHEFENDTETWAFSTRHVWDDGVPVLKYFSPSRADPHTVFFAKGTKLRMISAEGLHSGCPMVYWLLGTTWYCTTEHEAYDLIQGARTETGELPEFDYEGWYYRDYEESD